MVALPKSTFIDPTTERVKVRIAESQYDKPRTYMGMSGMGDPCDRRIWLRFRWAFKETHAITSLLAFDDGHTQEHVMIKRLKDAGFNVTDKQDGKQIALADFGGHFRGNMDGIISGLVNAPTKIHVYEHKSTNQTSFNKLVKLINTLGEKNALQAWKPDYYAQGILYMGYYGTDRHYMTVSTPGGRDFVGLRTELDMEHFLRLKAKGERLIFAERPPAKFEPDDWRCGMCNMRELCYGMEFGQKSCRTCAHVTPMRDGTWHCGRWDKTLTDQSGCPQHLFIPDLVPGKVLDAGKNWVKYEIDGKEFVNREQS